MRKAGSFIVLMLLLASMLTLTSGVQSARAVTGQTSTGWYWPAGADDTSGQYGFLAWSSKRSQWHLAQDFNRGQGLAVYAIADGEVVLSRTDIGGYGPGGTAGGALVARFETSASEFFIALYGHLNNPHAVGAVQAGEVLGYANDYSPPHLHFGIHLGYGLPSNPWQGYTSNKSVTYGWVDPVQFLLNNHPLSAANPSASFTTSPSTGANVSELIILDASGSTSPGGSIASYQWNFGDNNITSTTSPVINHAYSLPNTYTVTLTVTSDKGLTDSCSSSVKVQSASIPVVAKPVVAYTSADRYSGIAPLAVQFSGAGSGGVPPYSYSWVFGDGSAQSNVQNPTHTYSSVGSFTVTLTVTDSVGGHASDSVSIEASAHTVFISILTESASAAVGSPVYLCGRLLDSDGVGLQNESVVLSLTLPGTDSWVPISSTLTDSVGSYSIQWINMASGTFTLKAEWVGNATYNGVSRTATLSFLPCRDQQVLLLESNSTVSALAFNSTSSVLSFTVNGSEGTFGYVKAIIAMSLMENAENLKVYLDGNQLNYTLTSTATSWVLAITYTHSTHQVKIALASNEQVPTASADLVNSSNPVPPGGDRWIYATAVGAAIIVLLLVRYTIVGKRKSPSVL
jgi:PKD repeat protein